MEQIKVFIEWCDHNFGATFGDNVPGAVVLTAKTYDVLMKEIPETLQFHVEGMVADGDEVPEWLRNGEYEFDYELDTAALIRSCEQYASLAAISRASGVNERLLSHYANGIKKPRPQQRKRIVEGLHEIGRKLIAVV
ncbi:CopG family transcriptional regulator [Prevotella amnii]|uniref:CopG family transcriptional regulator n=2 Tax=Prevotella amnii TaxID=419005 RepID=A0A096AWV6_9BACT|nr:CopG family transcriptional regulator [Prevotella amnii]KGF51568.1 CopG family transcriptional regulator [Prevotella amnii DNF00058]